MHPVKAHVATDLRHQSLSPCVTLRGRPRAGISQPCHVLLVNLLCMLLHASQHDSPVPTEKLYLQGRGGPAARCGADSNPAAPAIPSKHTEEHAQQVVLPVPLAEKGEPGVLRKGKGPQRLTREALLAASPTARAALFTGLYILGAGLALLVAPLSVFTLLFDQR